jgi:hypothetical protein
MKKFVIVESNPGLASALIRLIDTGETLSTQEAAEKRAVQLAESCQANGHEFLVCEIKLGFKVKIRTEVTKL